MTGDNLFGFINIYKPVGITSHDVVSILRRITKTKQIGHTGTLDPFAEGVLPIAIGKASRLIEYLSDDKAYIGRFCFGKSTNTYDIEGEVVNIYDERLTGSDFKNLPLPQGKIEQMPPIYSAKKVNGKKLYEYARAGIEVEIKPSLVEVYKSELLDFDEDEQFADIYIECSKGTYIRSIANDLGKSINNGCYLSKLKRVKSGFFNLDSAVRLDELSSLDDVLPHILNPIEYLDIPTQELNDVEYSRIAHGMNIYNRIGAVQGNVMLVKNKKLISIAEISDNGLKPKKVLQIL